MTRSHITMIAAVAVTAAIAFSTTLRAQARPEVALRTAIEQEEGKGDVKGAIEQYKRLADGRDRAVAAQALLRLGQAYQRLGDVEAKRVYERLIRDFGEQRDVITQAQGRLQALGGPEARTSQSARRMVPIWTGEGVGYGRPSLDGRYIAFQAGTGDLAIRDVVANMTRQLTDTGGWVKSGDFVDSGGAFVSPDNRQVAYTWFIDAESRYELRIMAIGRDSSAPRTLISDKDGYVRPVGWTPDGSRVIVSRSTLGAWQLGVVTVSDGRYQTIKSLEWRDPGNGVSVSPDGRYVAYQTPSGQRGSNRDIMLLALDGSRETSALASPEDDFNPFWSPDGAHLVFMRADTGGPALWALPMRAGQPVGTPQLVRSDLGRMNPLGITRNGSLYYALTGAQRHNIYVAQLADGAATASSLVASQVFDGRTGPAWTPNGEVLTYWAASPQPAITVRSMKTGQERTVALPPGTITNLVSPKWFPDGRTLLIAVRSGDRGAAGLFRFDIDTGVLELLHQGALTNPRTLAVAPDGSAVFWAVQSTNEATPSPSSGRVMRFDLKTREETELKRDVGALAMAISPDGKELAYLRNDRTDRSSNEAPGYLEVIPTQGGDARQVFRDPIWFGPSRFNTLAWSLDQQSLLAVRDDGILWRIPLNGGAPRETGISAKTYQFGPGQSQPSTPADRRVKSPAIHPDGKTLAFAVAEVQDREIWSLENFLPVAKK